MLNKERRKGERGRVAINIYSLAAVKQANQAASTASQSSLKLPAGNF